MSDKLPTVEETVNGIEFSSRHSNSWNGWYYSHDSVVEAIETHTRLHTEALRENNERLKKQLESMRNIARTLHKR